MDSTSLSSHKLYDLSANNLSQHITSTKIQELVNDSYTVIDNILPACHAGQLLAELTHFAHAALMGPNRTHFGSSVDGKPLLFVKPGIFEVDLHDETLRQQMPSIDRLCSQSDVFVYTLQEQLTRFIPMRLQTGVKGRTIKVQWNNGQGVYILTLWCSYSYL